MYKKIFYAILMAFMCITSKVTAQIQSGLPVPLTLTEGISSEYLKQGDIVNFKVSSEIYDSEGELIIPEGTPAYGTVLSVKKRGGFSKGGKFEIAINYLALPNGQKVELTADNLSAKGKSGSAVSTAMKVCYWMFWTIIIDACIKGGYATLDAGTAVQAYTK